MSEAFRGLGRRHLWIREKREKEANSTEDVYVVTEEETNWEQQSCVYLPSEARREGEELEDAVVEALASLGSTWLGRF